MINLEWLVEMIRGGGPLAAIASGVLVGLGLTALIIARTVGLVSSGKADMQGPAFQDRLLKFVDALTANETALRQRIDRLQGDNQTLAADKIGMAEEIAELRASLALLRHQRKRLIELMRTIKSDRLGPAAIRAAGIELELAEGFVPVAGS